MRPKCIIDTCCNPAKYNGYKKDGSRKYKKYCSYHDKRLTGDQEKRKEMERRAWRKQVKLRYNGYNKKGSCEKCGFKASHPCQLDIHHIDGNHTNNSINNLTTLCANCHRLITLLLKQGIYKY